MVMRCELKIKATPLLSLVCALIICGCRQQSFVSRSMQPTIKPGEKVIVDYTAYAVATPKRWDVVAFEPPTFTNQIWLMRVVALPGESVSFATGGITINGQPLALPPHVTNVVYVSLDHPALTGQGSRVPSPFVVPSGSYFVLGDCSTNSNDSRMWGALPRTKIFGKVRGK
jgi:signal peptidase I